MTPTQPTMPFAALSKSLGALFAALLAILLAPDAGAQPSSKAGRGAPFQAITPEPTKTPSPFHTAMPAAATATPAPTQRRGGDRNANNTGQPQRVRPGRASAAPASPLVESINKLIGDVQRAAKDRLPQDALFPPGTKCLAADLTATGTLIVRLSGDLIDRPITPDDPKKIEDALAPAFAATSLPAGTRIALYVGADPLAKWITSPALIKERQSKRDIPGRTLAQPVVQRVSYAGPARTGGLEGRNYLVAPSHGWYWDKNSTKWEYQRPRLFTTVEDLFPQSYVNPFLIPMLENAGAVVWSARERDTQRMEYIVDNDAQNEGAIFHASGAWAKLEGATGWRGGVPGALGAMDEPFTFGTVLSAAAVDAGDKSTTPTEVTYVPYVAKTGRYAVYVSWAMGKHHSPSVPVVVRHRGGETTFRVNQQVAGNTWVILGFFEFEQGSDAKAGSVSIRASGATTSDAAKQEGKPTLVTADAVRFGGGMGNVAPNGTPSGHPRYTEGARYWTQYAGAPAKLVFHRSTTNTPRETPFEYNNDITSRPEWGNFLQGAPNGPNGSDESRGHPGLGVPIDAQIHFHTDAGITTSGLVGTLSIYRLEDDRKPAQTTFPDGRSRILNRDLAGLVQDEICRDVRAEFTSTWARRALGQGRVAYGEARRPNSPTILLELLSHQNFNDMKYGIDPRFKKQVARAIYKGFLRFTAYSNGFTPIVQPLEPAGIAVHAIAKSTAEVVVVPQLDPLEPTAKPTGYVIYRSTDGIGFDNGELTSEPKLTVTGLDVGKAYYFRATQVNAGGESLPSAVVVVRVAEPGAKKVLIVDGFDRIAAPSIVDTPEYAGFGSEVDPGVGYHIAHGYVGAQFDYDPRSKFVTNDEPGWGASKRDFENVTVKGNTFDHAAVHAKALEGTPYAIDSSTASAYVAGALHGDYAVIDWIAGFSRTTIPPPGMNGIGAPDKMEPEFPVLSLEAAKKLRAHVAGGGALILSGTYVGTDLLDNPVAEAKPTLGAFAKEVLGFETATRVPRVNLVVSPTTRRLPGSGKETQLDLPRNTTIRFGSDMDGEVIRVARPESLQATSDAAVALVDPSTLKASAVLNGRALTIAFPIETVLPEKNRSLLLKAAMKKVLE